VNSKENNIGVFLRQPADSNVVFYKGKNSVLNISISVLVAIIFIFASY
jgi:hypothetical protein